MSTFACTPGSTGGFKATDKAATDAADPEDAELSDACIWESTVRAEASELDNAASPELQTDSWLKTAEPTDVDIVGRGVVDMCCGRVSDAPGGQLHCVFATTVPGPSVLVVIDTEHVGLLVEDGGLDVAAGVALLVGDGDGGGGGVNDALGLGLLVEGGRELLLLNVVLKPLAPELTSDKMLLQMAEYDASSEKSTMLQTPAVSVVVVAVAEQPLAMEHVTSPQLVVRVVPGVAVLVMFHVEHGCVQTDTDDVGHELDVVEELGVLDAVPVADSGLGLSLIQNGPTQPGLGRHDPTQLGGGTGGRGGGCHCCQYDMGGGLGIVVLEERAIRRRHNNLQLEEYRDRRMCRREGSRASCCNADHIATHGISTPSRHRPAEWKYGRSRGWCRR